MDLRPRVRSGKETAEKTWNLVKHVSISRSSEKAWTGFSFQCTENARTEGDQDDGDDEDNNDDDVEYDQDDNNDEENGQDEALTPCPKEASVTTRQWQRRGRPLGLLVLEDLVSPVLWS